MNEPQDFEDGDDGPEQERAEAPGPRLQDLGVALVELPQAELDALDAAREPARRDRGVPRASPATAARLRQRHVHRQAHAQDRRRADPRGARAAQREGSRSASAASTRSSAGGSGCSPTSPAPGRARRSWCRRRPAADALAGPPGPRRAGGVPAAGRVAAAVPAAAQPCSTRPPKLGLCRESVQCRGETARRHHHGVDLRLGDHASPRPRCSTSSACRTKRASSRRTARPTCCSNTPRPRARAASRSSSRAPAAPRICRA